MRASTTADTAARSPIVEGLGRLGYVAMGAIYGIIALLALLVAFGEGGKTTDKNGALQTVAAQPFGGLLLWILAAGFAAYAIWRATQAFLDRDDEGSDAKGLAKRAGYLGRAALYAGLAYVAISIASGGGGGSSSEDQKTAEAMTWPGGVWLVAAVGAGFLGAAGFNVYRGLSQSFRKKLDESSMSGAEQTLATAVGTAGLLARGVVFGLIGIFLVKAAWEYDPDEAVGLDGALRTLANQAYGQVLLGLTAAGLLAFAAFCLVQARYREI